MKGFILMAVLASLLLTSCTSSRILSSWTAPQAGAKSYSKILVTANIPYDHSTRLQMETSMVKDLQEIGYHAVSFLQAFNEAEFQSLRYDSARARFQRQGIDGLITINLLATEKETVYVQAKQIGLTEPLMNKPFWENNSPKKETQNAAGYYVNTTQLFWESNFFDLSSLALLYHVKSISFDSESAQKMSQQYGRQVVHALQKNYVLPTKIL